MKIAHRIVFGFAVIDILLEFFLGNGVFMNRITKLTKREPRETGCLQIFQGTEIDILFCYVMLCCVMLACKWMFAAMSVAVLPAMAFSCNLMGFLVISMESPVISMGVPVV